MAAKQPVTTEVSSSLVVETGKEDNGDVSKEVIRRKCKAVGPPQGKQ